MKKTIPSFIGYTWEHLNVRIILEINEWVHMKLWFWFIQKKWDFVTWRLSHKVMFLRTHRCVMNEYCLQRGVWMWNHQLRSMSSESVEFFENETTNKYLFLCVRRLQSEMQRLQVNAVLGTRQYSFRNFCFKNRSSKANFQQIMICGNISESFLNCYTKEHAHNISCLISVSLHDHHFESNSIEISI